MSFRVAIFDGDILVLEVTCFSKNSPETVELQHGVQCELTGNVETPEDMRSEFWRIR